MDRTYPPGPRDRLLGISFFGHVRRAPLAFVAKVARDYGDFAFLRVGWVRLYLVNRPELIREILSTKVKSFRKVGRQMNALRKIEGEGLVVSDGDIWTRHRPLVQGSFHGRHMREYARVVVEHTRRRLENWRPGETFDVAGEMNELALEIIARVVFGVDLADDAARLRDAIHVARASMQKEMSAMFVVPDWLPLPSKLRQRRALRAVDRLIWDLIRQRRDAAGARNDMLGQMLAAAAKVQSGAPVTEAEIRDEAATLFVAGHDTTSATMAWFWHVLAQNAEAERRAVEEVDAVLGDRPPSFDDVASLKYLEMAVKESMRLYPASSFLFGREAVQDVELGGYTLRRGSWIFIAPFVVHRDASFFPDPEKFEPLRFAPENAGTIPPYAYIPFGGGPRICIGNVFAIMEMVLVAATVLQKFRLRLDQAQPKMELEVVLRPKGGLRMRALPKQQLKLAEHTQKRI
jgi:cytochrome P450